MGKWGGGGGGVVWCNCGIHVKGHLQYNIRVTVSEYKVYSLLLASPLL